MIYAHINVVPNGSTGSIMMKEHKELISIGEDSYAFWGRGTEAKDPGGHECRFATDAEVCLDVLQTRLDGRAGFHSKVATKRLLRKLDNLQPDVVHLHNIHGYYLNVKMLFEWLRNHDNVQVEWTLHDCWAFTGHCAYFTYVKCAQWQEHCAYLKPCPQLHTYPKTFSLSKSCRWSFEHKKDAFTSIANSRMKLITPSKWLADIVMQSFLKVYPVEVRHNTIDTTVFKPTPSNFREQFGIGNRFMILGVAAQWGPRKGLDDFVRLALELDSRKYVVVLVGLTEIQINKLPSNIVAISKTDNTQQLAKIYTAADVLFNPTKEDNYPTVNIEAEACGTPVITYDTGGCRETIIFKQSHVIRNYDGFIQYLNNNTK